MLLERLPDEPNPRWRGSLCPALMCSERETFVSTWGQEFPVSSLRSPLRQSVTASGCKIIRYVLELLSGWRLCDEGNRLHSLYHRSTCLTIRANTNIEHDGRWSRPSSATVGTLFEISVRNTSVGFNDNMTGSNSIHLLFFFYFTIL